MEHSLADRSEGGAPVVRTAEVFCCCIIQRGGSGDVIGGGGIKQYSLGRGGGTREKKGAKNGFFSPRLGDHFFTVPHYNLFCVFPIMFLQSYNRKSIKKKSKG